MLCPAHPLTLLLLHHLIRAARPCLPHSYLRAQLLLNPAIALLVNVFAASRNKSRPMSAQLPSNPLSLAAKIAGIQPPPSGAPIVQREAQAFQQRYGGSRKPSGGLRWMHINISFVNSRNVIPLASSGYAVAAAACPQVDWTT